MKTERRTETGRRSVRVGRALIVALNATCLGSLLLWRPAGPVGVAADIVVRAYLAYFASDLQRAKALALDAEKRAPDALRTQLLLAQIAERSGHLAEAERRATVIVLKVSDGFLLDRAFDILDTVYDRRRDIVKGAALEKVMKRHRGHDGFGRPR